MGEFNTNNWLNDYSSINNGKINKGSLFSANPPSVNFLLILFAVSYFIVGADLCKEMAVEKNEIGFFTATLEDSFHFDSSAILSLLEQVPLDCGILPPVSYSIHNSDVELFPPGRSPPSA